MNIMLKQYSYSNENFDIGRFKIIYVCMYVGIHGCQSAPYVGGRELRTEERIERRRSGFRGLGLGA